MNDRYARQSVLPEVGAAGQQQLSSAHVLVVGAGGLGCPVLQYLAGCGVGMITVVDPDVVSLSNLHRQILFTESDVEQPKAAVAATRLRALNSEISVTPIVAPLDPANASEWVENADVVLDCADSVAVTYTLSDVCLQHGVPLVSASVLGLSGYAGAFCADAPSVRAVFPDVPDTLANCSEAGVLGPVVGAIGAVQAQMVMSLLLQLPDSPLGSLWRFDGATLRVSTLRFNGAPEPARHFPFVAASHLRATDRVIELRDVQEAPQAVMASALRCLPADLEALAPATPGQRTVLCCHSGLRAWRAAERLQVSHGGELALLAAGSLSSLEH